MENSDFTVIAKFDYESEALLCKSLLESAGVACSLIHQTISSVLPFQADFMTIDLIVAKEDAERANEILDASFDSSEFEEHGAAQQ